MQKLNILPGKKVKLILSLLKKQFGFDDKLEYAFLQNEKGRIYLISKDISKLELAKIRINTLGLYFGELRNNEIRVSIEGSQIIGPKSNKNILSLDDNQKKQWLSGEDLTLDTDLKGFVLICNKKDFLGCGKVSNGKVFNYVGKSRRISIS